MGLYARFGVEPLGELWNNSPKTDGDGDPVVFFFGTSKKFEDKVVCPCLVWASLVL